MEEKSENNRDSSRENVHRISPAVGASKAQSTKLSAESISDEQELFIKVLENLKRAVAKPENPHVALPKKSPVKSSANENVSRVTTTLGATPQKDNDVMEQMDVEEPGTTKVTVSEKTKSLILQKLAAGTYVIDIEKDEVVNTVDSKVTDGAHVKVSVMGFDKVTHKVTEKDIVSARSIKTEDTTLSAHDLQHKINVPVLKNTTRLIAPATPSVQLFTCNFCDYYSENKNYLKQHIDLVHNSDRPFKCPYCDYAGKRSHALREHMIVHSDERPYQCKSCNATFRKKGHLTNHIKLHNSKRLVKCPICKALVYDTGENGLDAHLKNDHDTERLYGCDLCEHVAANEPNILKHLHDKHKSKISLHRCDKCPFETASNVDFNAHVAAHNMSDSHVQIGKSLSQVIGVATVPTGSHDFGPANTNVRLTTKDTITGSQPAVIKPVWIKCSECGFTAQDSEIIKRHMLEHLKLTEIPEIIPATTVKELSVKTSTQQPPLPGSIRNSDAKVSLQPSPSINSPVLVPVTNVDQLFPHHAGKLDMRAPILVPVTDVNMIKSLQSSNSPLKLIKVPETGTNTLSSTSQIGSANNHFDVHSSLQNTISAGSKPQPTSSSAVNMPQTVVFSSLLSSLKTSGPQTVMSVTSSPTVTSPSGGHVIQLQRHEMEQLLKNPSLKVVPVNANQPSIDVTPSGTTATYTSANSTVSTRHGTIVGMLQNQQATPAKMTTSSSSPMYLNQIPIPRLVNTNQVPKLPPDIVQLKSPFSETSREEVEQASPTPPAVDNEEQKLSTLRQSLVKVQKLIEQHDKLNKQVGNVPQAKVDTQGILKQNQKVVYYLAPVEKKNNSKNAANAGFTHDSNAGRFKCTLCGYTCEYQRTIKAHIWKHSGNKDIDYPMFQNGPLSIYEDGQVLKSEEKEIVHKEVTLPMVSVPVAVDKPDVRLIAEPANKETDASSAQASGSQMPNFIVYEQTKISQVAPALAQLIAARAMVGLKETDKGIPDDDSSDSYEEMKDLQSDKDIDDVQGVSTPKTVGNHDIYAAGEMVKCNMLESQGVKSCDQTKMNVVVETVESVASSYTGFTGMRSQQGSPRITTMPRSPDSGVSEMTLSSKAAEDTSSSGLTSPLPNFEYFSEESKFIEMTKRVKRGRSGMESESGVQLAPEAKKIKMSSSHEDSAVTLLSLLKKGPNFNPACPPKVNALSDTVSADYSNSPSPPNEDSNSIGETEMMSGTKPKTGISTSLLAVIEQLRERSKCDTDEDKLASNQTAKKPSKRRSRKSSVDDNTTAQGIHNVEEFVSEGEIKYRCKLCHYTNESTVLLKQHMRLHKPKQEFECSLCDLIADSSEALQDHMIQHCKVRTYQCKLCNLHFNYKSQLRAHMRMHNDQDILMCDFCDFETRSSSALKAHTKSHLTKPPYKCEFCKEEFITSFNLRVHKREGCYTSVLSDKSGNFKCNECDFTSIGRREMKAHQKCHMGRNTVLQPKQCPYCEHTALSTEQIQQHISDTHGESKPLKCELCGFVAVSIRSLKSHMKRHVNDQRFVAQPLEQYKCNLCGYVCHHLPSLKSHMWRHAADQHYSYEFTNDVINAAIDFDSHTEAGDTTEEHVEKFRNFIYEKMKAKGLENTRNSQEESAIVCCWVDFRCCQCGFETINKAELNLHMAAHSDVIKWTLKVPYSPDGSQTTVKTNTKDDGKVSI